MPEQLNLVHVQNPNEIQSPENEHSGLEPSYPYKRSLQPSVITTVSHQG